MIDRYDLDGLGIRDAINDPILLESNLAKSSAPELGNDTS